MNDQESCCTFEVDVDGSGGLGARGVEVECGGETGENANGNLGGGEEPVVRVDGSSDTTGNTRMESEFSQTKAELVPRILKLDRLDFNPATSSLLLYFAHPVTLAAISLDSSQVKIVKAKKNFWIQPLHHDPVFHHHATAKPLPERFFNLTSSKVYGGWIQPSDAAKAVLRSI